MRVDDLDQLGMLRQPQSRVQCSLDAQNNGGASRGFWARKWLLGEGIEA